MAKDTSMDQKINQDAIEQTESKEIWLDGLRSHQECVKQKPKNIDGSSICRDAIEKRSKKGLIEMNLSKICREAVELEERRFFKEVETHKDEYIKQATQSKIQTTY